MHDFARRLTRLIGLVFLVVGPVGCGPVASLEPIYTEKDLVFDPAALGTWYYDDIHVRVTQHGEKAYRLVVMGAPYEGYHGSPGREFAMFEAHLVRLKDHLFLDLFPQPYEDQHSQLSEWYVGSVGGVHQMALVKQLSPAPIVAFMDGQYLEENPPVIHHILYGKDEMLLTASTRKVQRFLRRAVKRGAFNKDQKWTASKATALHFAAPPGSS